MSDQVYKIRLKKGDTVVVRSGKYKGKSGKVRAVHPTLNAVTVEGINIVKKHQKPTKANPQGGIIELTKPIAVGKVGISEGGKPSRIGYKVDAKGNKTRVAKKSGKAITEPKAAKEKK
jgi:large subunit ribosomal protein L24